MKTECATCWEREVKAFPNKEEWQAYDLKITRHLGKGSLLGFPVD